MGQRAVSDIPVLEFHRYRQPLTSSRRERTSFSTRAGSISHEAQRENYNFFYFFSLGINLLQKLIELGNHNSTAVSTSNSVPLTRERFKITMGTSWVSIMRPLKRANYKTSECSWEPVPHLKMASLLPRATLKAQESGHPDGRASEPLTLVQQDLLNVFHTILEKMEILLATPKIFKKWGKKQITAALGYLLRISTQW